MSRRFQVTADDGGIYFGAETEIQNLPSEYRNAILAQMERLSKGKGVEPITVPAADLERAGWLTEEKMKATMVKEERESISDDEELEDKKSLIRRRTPAPITSAPSQAMLTDLNHRIEALEHSRVGDCTTCPLRTVAEKVIAKTLEKI